MAKKSIPNHRIKNQAPIGKRFHRLVVLAEIEQYIDPKTGKRIRMVSCKCDCGNTKNIRLNALISGNTKSCGCFATQRRKEFSTKHGYCLHTLYKVWSNMKDRCLNENNKRFEYYGEKGITVCDKWVNRPDKFIEWAKNNGWEKGLFLDRIDVDDDYYPENCRFVDIYQSNQNTSRIRKNNSSGFRGVTFDKSRNAWQACINVNGDEINIGRFETSKDAAIAYDNEVVKHNSFHPLNFGG